MWGKHKSWDYTSQEGKTTRKRNKTTVLNGKSKEAEGMKAEAYLGSLHFELHVVFSRCLSVFPFLPAVTIPAISHLFAAIEQHGATLRSETRRANKY
jgi:hypothetical protein